MSDKESKFKEHARRTYVMLLAILGVFVLLVVGIIYTLKFPENGMLTPEEKVVDRASKETIENEDIYDIKNGIHVRTGFVEGEGLITVIQNCTNCHSAKLVTQNRMTKEQWKATIHWMQETQNLWDLGDNEEIILNYLATNYAPSEEGRRKKLEDIEWYTLKKR